MSDIKIQIYGIRTVEDARMVIDLGAHHIGVSYGKIKRTPGQVSCEEAKEVFENVQPHAVKVGLTVSVDIDEITEDLSVVVPDVLHLSGDIDGIKPSEVRELKRRFPGLKIMQAIPVTGPEALDYVRIYESVSDFFLLDTKAEGANDIGATGITHDWTLDRAIVESTKVPCIIAGGLHAGNVAQAIRISRPYGVDSFSHTNYDRPEPGKGIKDPAKVKAFVEAVRKASV